MSFEALSERLSQLQDTTAQLQELIGRLAGLRFAPGAVPLSIDDADDSVAGELAAEIGQIIREEEEDLELLLEEIEDCRVGGGPGTVGVGGGVGGGSGASEEERDRGVKDRLRDGARRLEGELRSCRVSFRKAQSAAKKSLEAAQKQERALLLQSYAIPPASAASSLRSGASSPDLRPEAARQLLFKGRRRRKDGQSEQAGTAVQASADVTAALRRTHAMMEGEVARSEFVQQSIAESTAALRDLGTRYEDLGGLLKRSGDLVGSLLRSNKSDTWYLQTALYMLAITLGWLVFRRLLYGPLWLLVWLPVRLVFGGAWKAGSAVGGLAGAGKAAPSMELHGGREGGAKTIVGMEEGAVPTVKVGKQERTAGDPESMVEKVGRIIDGDEVDGEAETPEDAERVAGSDDAPNPKKHMREDHTKADRAKDEL